MEEKIAAFIMNQIHLKSQIQDLKDSLMLGVEHNRETVRNVFHVLDKITETNKYFMENLDKCSQEERIKVNELISSTLNKYVPEVYLLLRELEMLKKQNG